MPQSCRVPILLFLTLVLGCISFSQSSPARVSVDVPMIPARLEDVSSIDGVIRAYYDVISGPAGQPRQWSRDRTLYVPDVRFVAISADKAGKPMAHVMTHQQFVDSSNAGMVKNGFFENEIHRVTQQFGNIAQVFSTYESRLKQDGPVIERGINSLQLYFDGQRWWIASATWQDESTDVPIPQQYLTVRK